MLLVEDSMTREVTTVWPRTTAGGALALCRQKRIRHLPVLEGGELVGIVSDRDLRSATPALGDPARAAALNEIPASEVMTPEVLTAHPGDPIEHAANLMRERNIGCLPVLENGTLAGIITSSDVMEAFVYLLGAHEPGSRLEVALPDRPGSLARLTNILAGSGVDVVSMVTAPEWRVPTGAGAAERVAVFRLDTIDPRQVVKSLQREDYRVLWPPGT